MMTLSTRGVLALLVAGAMMTSGCAARRGGGSSVGSGAPASFARLASEGEVARTIQVREGLSKAAAWRALTDYLSQRYTVSVRDQNAGFAMTNWQSLVRDGVPDLRYRTRLMLTFVGDDWRQLQVRAEANWRENDQWQVGVDRELLDRAAAELQSRVGRATTQGR